MVVSVALLLVVMVSSASSRPATGGVGRLGGAIDWVEWGTKGQVLDLSGPVTRQSVTSFAGHDLTISNFARTGGGVPALSAYASGGWSGDALDDLYNVGGVDLRVSLLAVAHAARLDRRACPL
jgi:hypothetical protein